MLQCPAEQEKSLDAQFALICSELKRCVLPKKRVQNAKDDMKWQYFAKRYLLHRVCFPCVW